MNHRNLSLASAFVLIGGLGAVISGCSNGHPAQTAALETVGGVRVVLAQKTTVPDWMEVVGTVQAAQTSQVASQMAGNIVEIRAREGDRVQNGQILAVIDDAQPRAAVQQAAAAVAAAEKEVAAAESDFALAGTTLKRYQQLYDKRSVSPQEFDEFRARYQAAEARRDVARAQQTQASAALTQARTALGYALVRAPYSGVVTQKKADAGTLVAPGTPIFTIEDTRSYHLDVTVDEGEIRLVHPGMAAPVVLELLGDADLSGRVAQIVPAADPASRSFLVKIALPAAAPLRSGLFGRARFSKGERSALLIPLAALVERGQLEGVYVIGANGIAALRYVTLGKPAAQEVEVLSGLQEGEKLVAAPGSREFSGKKIAVQQ